LVNRRHGHGKKFSVALAQGGRYIPFSGSAHSRGKIINIAVWAGRREKKKKFSAIVYAKEASCLPRIKTFK